MSKDDKKLHLVRACAGAYLFGADGSPLIPGISEVLYLGDPVADASTLSVSRYIEVQPVEARSWPAAYQAFRDRMVFYANEEAEAMARHATGAVADEMHDYSMSMVVRARTEAWAEYVSIHDTISAHML